MGNKSLISFQHDTLHEIDRDLENWWVQMSGKLSGSLNPDQWEDRFGTKRVVGLHNDQSAIIVMSGGSAYVLDYFGTEPLDGRSREGVARIIQLLAEKVGLDVADQRPSKREKGENQFFYEDPFRASLHAEHTPPSLIALRETMATMGIKSGSALANLVGWGKTTITRLIRDPNAADLLAMETYADDDLRRCHLMDCLEVAEKDAVTGEWTMPDRPVVTSGADAVER